MVGGDVTLTKGEGLTILVGGAALTLSMARRRFLKLARSRTLRLGDNAGRLRGTWLRRLIVTPLRERARLFCAHPRRS